MKLNFSSEKIIEELQHASPVKTGKRFQSFFVDCMVVILLSYLCFLASNAIAINTNIYKTASIEVKEEIAYYNNYVAESRVMEFDVIDGEVVRKDQLYVDGISKIVLENINRAIYHSYTIFGDFSNQFGISISDENMELIKSSVSDKGQIYDDNISYFYTSYLLNNENEFEVSFTSLDDAIDYLQQTYKNSFGEDANTLLVFDKEKSAVPILKQEAASYLYYFVYVAEDKEVNEIAKEYYYAFETSYSGMLKQAENIMVKSEPYYSTHYMNYFNNNAILGRSVNIALIIAIIIGYLIGILLPKLILKHGRTLGRFVFKLGEISFYNEEIGYKEIIIKTIFGCFGYLSVIFLIYMFAPFNGIFDAMFMPFIGETPLVIILLIIFALVIINGIFMLFTKNKIGYDGLITKTILVDRKHLDEFEED